MALLEQAALQLDEVDVELFEQAELHVVPINSSSVSQLKRTDGTVKHAKIGRIFFAPLLKNSLLLSTSSLEILSVISMAGL